jgi:arylsulfatase A-like enzyme
MATAGPVPTADATPPRTKRPSLLLIYSDQQNPAVAGCYGDPVVATPHPDTLIVYLSDHGEQLGELELWWKQALYEHAVRVPCILSWPGVLPQGERCGRVVSPHDASATLLEVGGSTPEGTP